MNRILRSEIHHFREKVGTHQSTPFYFEINKAQMKERFASPFFV